jgi:hypothetical protein
MVACAHCGEVIGNSAFVYHMRLNAAVHMGCPLTNIRGEDISLHTMYLYDAIPSVNDTIEGKKGS